MLTDNNSANGTTVNGIEIEQSYELKEGDVVELGTIVLTFKPAENNGVTSPVPPSAGVFAPSVNGFVNRNTMALKRGSRGWRSTLVQPITSPGRLQRNNIDMVTILPSAKKYEENVHVREELSGEADDFLPESQVTDESILRSDYEKLRLAYDLSKIGLTDNLDALCHHMLDIMFQTLKAQRGNLLIGTVVTD
jgi:adenylate cyclase